MVHVRGQTLFGIGLLVLVVFSLWHFVVVSLVVLEFAVVLAAALYLVQRMHQLEDELDQQRAQLSNVQGELVELRRGREVDLRDRVPADSGVPRFVPGDYVGAGAGRAQRPEWADTTWPGRSRYS